MRFAPAWLLQKRSRPLSHDARRWAVAGFDLVFPPSCALCRADLESSTAGLLGEPCRVELVNPRSVCPRCAMPATSDLASSDRCPRCRTETFHFDQAVSLGRYE